MTFSPQKLIMKDEPNAEFKNGIWSPYFDKFFIAAKPILGV